MKEHLDVHGMIKPLLRGRLHVAAFLVSIPAAVALVFLAESRVATVSAGIYGATLVALFGISGAYHRLGRTLRSQRWLRRLDHATIYLLIAGSYTPVSIVAIGGRVGWGLAIAVWSVAILGGALKLFCFERIRLAGGVLYLALGWAALAAVPALLPRVSAPTMVLLAAGGLTYTVGAVVLARRWPDPLPRTFGYHEIWHAMTIVAAAFHYTAILRIVS